MPATGSTSRSAIWQATTGPILFLLDFANRQRIKVWGRARVVENDPKLMEKLVDPGYRARPERAILFTIEAWDVNCSQHITERYTQTEVAVAVSALRDRIAALEAENAELRGQTGPPPRNKIRAAGRRPRNSRQRLARRICNYDFL